MQPKDGTEVRLSQGKKNSYNRISHFLPDREQESRHATFGVAFAATPDRCWSLIDLFVKLPGGRSSVHSVRDGGRVLQSLRRSLHQANTDPLLAFPPQQLRLSPHSLFVELLSAYDGFEIRLNGEGIRPITSENSARKGPVEDTLSHWIIYHSFRSDIFMLLLSSYDTRVVNQPWLSPGRELRGSPAVF